MARENILLPKMGESVAEATVTKWLVEEGDQVKEDDPVLEIATDKVDSEIPAPADGILEEKKCKENDVIKVGEVIGILKTEAEEGKEEDSKPPPSGAAQDNGQEREAVEEVESSVAVKEKEAAKPELSSKSSVFPRTDTNGRFLSPLVRNIAQTEGVTLNELGELKGTGQNGRVTKHDILKYISERGEEKVVDKEMAEDDVSTSQVPASGAAKEEEVSTGTLTESQEQEVPIGENDEVEEMDRMRKLIADHMVKSKRTSPHVTSFVEADLTNIVMWREKIKKSFEEREGEKITFTPIFVEAVVQALKEFPRVNVSLSGNKIIKRGDLNIGMATALPNGNLIVPVIKNADQYNLIGLTKKVNDLSKRARDNKLNLEETQGGTFTLTNVGTFGNVMGTPVINQPQVAILATGSIQKKPSVIETSQGDMIGIRHKMFLSHSYDHRIVDGALGGSFVKRVAEILENFNMEREV